MKREMLCFAFVAITLGTPVCALAFGKASEHSKVFRQVINGYDDYRLRQFYDKFSSDIDNNKNAETSTSISARIKRAIASKYGVNVKAVSFTKHRYIAHQWRYQSNIPYEDLQLIEKTYSDCREDIIKIWQQFCRESNNYITSEFALQRSPWIAKSYCAILYYTHIVCDWLPDVNDDYDYLMSLDDIVDELVLAVQSMGRSDRHKKYCSEFEMKLRTALRLGNSNQGKAVKILEVLKEMKIGTMLHEHFGKYMDESRHPYQEETVGMEYKKAA